MKHILESEFRTFLNIVDKEVQAQIPITFEDLEERVGSEEKRIRRSLKMLKQKYPAVKRCSKNTDKKSEESIFLI